MELEIIWDLWDSKYIPYCFVHLCLELAELGAREKEHVVNYQVYQNIIRLVTVILLFRLDLLYVTTVEACAKDLYENIT